jgi:nucleoside-diphosphate-sugar epimerase
MRFFVTGAAGFIGSAVVHELLTHGHQVVGLARSDANVKRLGELGAAVHRGSLEDLDSLRRGAAESDGVIHTAFIHDFRNYAASAVVDARAIEALGETLAGSNRPLVVTGGVVRVPGQTATEATPAEPGAPRVSEASVMPFASRGVRAVLVRLPPTVHGAGDHGFVPELIRIARESQVAGFIGDGSNRWPAVHRLDAARAFRLAAERAPAGTRVHAIAEEGVTTRAIAGVIGRKLSLPVEPRPVEHFGWLGRFWSFDAPTSSEATRALLGWAPTQPALLEDLEQQYFGA